MYFKFNKYGTDKTRDVFEMSLLSKCVMRADIIRYSTISALGV